MKNITAKTLTIFKLAMLLLVVGVCFIAISPVFSADTSLLEQTGLSKTQETAQLPAEYEGDIAGLIGVYLGYAGYLAATLMLILIIYGGYMWMMAGGNDEIVKKGQKYIIWAVIGYVIIAASYVILTYITNLLPSK